MSLLSKVRRLRGSSAAPRSKRRMDAELRITSSSKPRRSSRAGSVRPRRATSPAGAWQHRARERRVPRDVGMRAIDALAMTRATRCASAQVSRYTALVLFTLALGSAANTAIFRRRHAGLIRPLPYAHGDRSSNSGRKRPGSAAQRGDVRSRKSPTIGADRFAGRGRRIPSDGFNLLGQGTRRGYRPASCRRTSSTSSAAAGSRPHVPRKTTRRTHRGAASKPRVLAARVQGRSGNHRRTFEMNDRTHTVVGCCLHSAVPRGERRYMPPSSARSDR